VREWIKAAGRLKGDAIATFPFVHGQVKLDSEADFEKRGYKSGYELKEIVNLDRTHNAFRAQLRLNVSASRQILSSAILR
jgi:hypothetical protein